MRSKADYLGQIMDCRQLILDARFYCLPEETTLEMALSLYTFINDLFGEQCVLSWKLRNRSLKNARMIKETRLKDDEYVLITADGDIKSKRISNKTTQRQYEKELDSIVFHLGLTPPFASMDYPEYAKRVLVPAENDPQRFRKAVIRTFSEEDRILVGQSQQHDMEIFYAAKRDEGNQLFCGEMFFRISLFCLDKEEVDIIANHLLNYITEVSERFTTINASIRIAQTEEEFNRIFGTLNIKYDVNVEKDPSERQKLMLINERVEYYYLKEVGWANIISPMLRSRLYEISPKNESKDALQSILLKNGSLLCRSAKRIWDCRISDLKTIKKSLYPILFPGQGQYLIHYSGIGGIRSHWENVPVFDDEIQIEGDRVIISHQMIPDREYLLAVRTARSL